VRESDDEVVKKRDRTRELLLDAALRVFAQKGIGEATIREIAAEAVVANGTFYNYFRTKNEVVAAASARLATNFADEIAISYARIDDPAERVSIAVRSFVSRAVAEPGWGWAMVRMTDSRAADPHLVDYFLKELRTGKRRGRLAIDSQSAAIDLVFGVTTNAMRTVLERRAGAGHDSATAEVVLRGLGVTGAEAYEIARRPLPPGATRPRLNGP